MGLQPSSRLAAALPPATSGGAGAGPPPAETTSPDVAVQTTATRDAHAGATTTTSSSQANDGHRTLWATIPVTAMFAGTMAKNGLDLARIFKKAPEAFAARTRALPAGASGIQEAIHSRVGRLPLFAKQVGFIAPDTRLIDPRAPIARMTPIEIDTAVAEGVIKPGGAAEAAARAGRSYDGIDRLANRTSGTMGAGLAALQLGVAIPNLIDGIQQDGLPGLWDSKSGRTGVLSLLGGGLGLGMMAPAFRGAQGASFGARLLNMAESPMLTSPLLANIGIAAGLLTFANELGFFDFMDKDNKRPVTQVLGDAWHKIPLLGSI